MFRKAGIGKVLAIKAAVLSSVMFSGGVVIANDQEKYVPADTHFYMGTGRPLPLDELMAVMPDITLPESAEGAEELKEIFEVFSNPEELITKWGVDTDLQVSMYTVGVAPVFRLALKDSDQFEKAITGFEKKHELTPRIMEADGLTTRFYSVATMKAATDDSAEGKEASASGDQADSMTADQAAANERVGLLVANDGTDTVISFVYDGENADLVNSVVGITKPEKSIAESGKLKEIRKQWGYGEELASFFDIQQIADTLTGEESYSSKQLAEMLPEDAKAQLGMVRSEPCRAEINGLAAAWPMIVSGTRQFDVGKTEITYDSHMAALVKHELLRDSLMLLRGVVPTSQSSSQPMVSVGLGVTVDKLAQAVGQFSQLLAAMNYQCGMLSGLNSMAQADLSAASMGVVMFGGLARGVQGMALNIFDIDVDSESSDQPLSSIDTAVAVSAEDPALLVQTLKMMPQLSILAELPLDGSELLLNPMLPVPVPENIQIKAAVKGKNIVIFSGEKGTDYANRLGGNDTEGFFTTQVDTRQILEKVQSVMEMTGQNSEEMTDIINMMESYPKGNILYQLDFTEQGIELVAGGTFQRPEK